MTIWTCRTCAVEHPDTDAPPAVCAICADERQWVPVTGQSWTTRDELEADGMRLVLSEIEPGLHAVTTSEPLGIGQRGLLVQAAGGNLLWDPPGFVDAAGVAAVAALGGLAAVASSHPHLTGSSIQWSHAFGGVPVWVAAADAEWIRRPDPVVQLWGTEVRGGVDSFSPVDGVRMLRCGGHFAGSAVAHWPGADGRGVLLAGDTVMVGADLASASAMRSYPNLIPLAPTAVRRILSRLEPLEYDRLYSVHRALATDAASVVTRSLTRYLEHLADPDPE